MIVFHRLYRTTLVRPGQYISARPIRLDRRPAALHLIEELFSPAARRGGAKEGKGVAKELIAVLSSYSGSA